MVRFFLLTTLGMLALPVIWFMCFLGLMVATLARIFAGKPKEEPLNLPVFLKSTPKNDPKPQYPDDLVAILAELVVGVGSGKENFEIETRTATASSDWFKFYVDEILPYATYLE